MTVGSEILRRVPSLDKILRTEFFRRLVTDFPRRLVVEETRLILARFRQRVTDGQMDAASLDRGLEGLGEAVAAVLCDRLSPGYRRVINATGVILHTNLGRAPISPAAAARITELVTGYSNLEYDLDRRCRSRRDVPVEKRLIRLLGCEAAAVCNNNAAAVFLILNTLAEGRKVLVSRGELVEIGGSFRIPAILSKSGAVLHEVGTTNRTRLSDYRDALDEQTGLILQVHTSNYRIVGFTHQPELPELVRLAREMGIPVVKDAGSGLLFPSSLPSLSTEPSIAEALRSGVDLVCFSGDKLLGGPQCGIIVGRRSLMERIRRNPLMRVVRVDKITCAALEQTLIDYENTTCESSLPAHRMLALTLEELERRSEKLKGCLGGSSLRIRLEKGYSVVGGGSAPLARIPTIVVRLQSPHHSVVNLEQHLRSHSRPILARVDSEELVLDLRTVLPEEDSEIATCLSGLESGG